LGLYFVPPPCRHDHGEEWLQTLKVAIILCYYYNCFHKHTGYYCDVCDLFFPFKSKYNRHLQSNAHQQLDVIVEELDCSLGSVQEINEVHDDHDESQCDDMTTFSSGEHLVNDIDTSYMYDDYNDVSDIDIDEIMKYVDDRSLTDFSPFPSVMHALLVMLLNSPRPMVTYNISSLVHTLLQGEKNLKFVLFICKKLDPSLPSLDTLKKFKLPGFIIPKQVSHFLM
jgi:hypothetical protein